MPTLSVVPTALDFADGHAALVFLLIDVPAAADFHLAPFGEEIDHGYAHAVQTAGRLIGAFAEFAAELEHRHHALQRGDAQIGVDFDRNAAAVIFDRARAVVVDRDRDLLGVAGHGLVDRIVDHFVYQVVQPAQRRVADIHAGPLAHVLEIAEVLEIAGAVFAFYALDAGHVWRRRAGRRCLGIADWVRSGLLFGLIVWGSTLHGHK